VSSHHKSQVSTPVSPSHQEISLLTRITAYLERALRIFETDTSFSIATAGADALFLKTINQQPA
jgi:hypothetical protein